MRICPDLYSQRRVRELEVTKVAAWVLRDILCSVMSLLTQLCFSLIEMC